jgi:hypothetical protein
MLENPPQRTLQRPVIEVKDPLLQWATGLPTTDRQIYAGWFSEAGLFPGLDKAMYQAGFSKVSIKHPHNTTEHWALESAKLFIVATGIQRLSEMSTTAERFGIAFGWRKLDNLPQSNLRVRVFIQELLEVGYMLPLLITLKSTVTQDFINALLQQYDVLDQVNPLLEKVGKQPLAPSFFSLSITLSPGESVTRGKNKVKEITPMVAIIPTEMDLDYLKEHWLRKSWAPPLEDILSDTINWSVIESKRISINPNEPPNIYRDS